jgi:hypothetical protein
MGALVLGFSSRSGGLSRSGNGGEVVAEMAGQPDSERDTRRSEFLIQWYGVLWSNVDRAMQGVWQLLGPMTVAGTIIAAVHKSYLPLSLGACLAFLVVLWALNMAIDLNNWHRRNLAFLSAVEREFLRESDYGHLIVRKYRRPSAKWITFYKINAIAFLSLLVFAAVYFRNAACKRGGLSPYPWVVVLVGLAFTGANFVAHEREARRRVSELFDSDVEVSGGAPSG